MAKFLFQVQQKNRLEQKGLLKRFSISCYGHQDSIEELRAEKAEKFKELKNKKGTKEYNEWFLNYRPEDKLQTKNEKSKNSEKSKNKPKKSVKKNKNKPKKKHYNFDFWGKNKTRKNKKQLY
jgi:hypothetical protein